MKVMVKAYGSWGSLLPNGKRMIDCELPEGSKISNLLAICGVEIKNVHTIALNGIVIKDDVLLNDEDSVTLFAPVSGGC